MIKGIIKLKFTKEPQVFQVPKGSELKVLSENCNLTNIELGIVNFDDISKDEPCEIVIVKKGINDPANSEYIGSFVINHVDPTNLKSESVRFFVFRLGR